MSLDMQVTFPSFPGTGLSPERSNRFQGLFPDPYLDYASTQMPRSLYDVFRWCEYIYLTWGVYRITSQRVVRYFLTSIELTDASDDEKQKYEEFLVKHLNMMKVLAKAGDDLMTYGNAFTSLRVPFRRYLRCPKCKIEQPIERMSYSWVNWKFTGECGNPKCGYKGELERVDRRSVEQDKLSVKHWSPYEIRILNHPITDEYTYYWDMPPWYRAEVKKGTRFYLESTPWEVVEAIKNNHMLRFAEGYIHHMREEVPAGVRTFGWGIPRVFGNFKQAWYIQTLKRYNEAIALDYIVPFRVLTPTPGTSREADPILHMNLPMFQAKVLSMFQQHRRDPATIHALPFPIQMQMLGAEGKELAPVDLINNGTDEFLNAQGVPAELYRGTLQIQAMPVALRLFERTWVHLVNDLNDLLNWLFTKISDRMNWENLSGRLQPVTLADDIEKKQIQLQLAAGSMISRQTAWAPFNINFREEIKRMFEEEEYSQEQMAKHQEQLAQKQELQQRVAQGAAGQPVQMMPGQQVGPQGQPMQAQGQPMQAQGQPMQGQPMPGAGAPAAGMPAAGAQVTPEDLMMQAEQIAYQMLSMPYELRRSELLKIKKANETLHALVISKMQQIRQSAQTQGGFQALQQAVGGGMPA